MSGDVSVDDEEKSELWGQTYNAVRLVLLKTGATVGKRVLAAWRAADLVDEIINEGSGEEE